VTCPEVQEQVRGLERDQDVAREDPEEPLQSLKLRGFLERLDSCRARIVDGAS